MLFTEGTPDRLNCTSRTCMQERAALVQIARDGNDKDDGLRGDGMNGRCTMIWR